MRCTLPGCLFVAIIGLAARAPAQTVLNASFETPTVATSSYTTSFGSLSTTVGAWTFGSSGSNSFDGLSTNSGGLDATGIGGATDPGGGTQAAFIQGTGTFSQAISFSSGGSFVLSFYAEGRSSTGAEPLSITIDATPIMFAGGSTFTPASTSRFDFATSDAFSLSSGSHTLTFTGTVPYTTQDLTTFLDQVSITAVPEPANVAVIVGGVGLLAAVALRRRRNMLANSIGS